LTLHAGASVSTHVLDTALGRPAAEIIVVLERKEGSSWVGAGRGVTDSDGRVRSMLSQGMAAAPGIYRLVFDTGAYFAHRGVPAFYPQVMVIFELNEQTDHYHVPLLLSPYGYSTYRGS
jgi:5-hydroxyisourate hydrolase